MANRKEYGFKWNTAYSGKSCPNPLVMAVADSYQAQDDASGFSVDLNVGDPVKLVSTGTVALANTTEDVYGIIVGIKQVYDSASGQIKPMNKVPGATTGGGVFERQTEVLVVPASAGIWSVQVDDNTTATTESAYQAFVGENVTHVCAGNSSLKTADPQLDISTHATTAGLVWRIVGVDQTQNNQDFSDTNVSLLVTINKSEEAGWPATTIAGV